MTKTEAVEFFHSLLCFGIKPGLERIAVLLEHLGNPQQKLKFVHVAGTNGKGSTCTEISNVLRCAGYKTGLYTSPYVLDFSERIQINNKMIPDDALASFTEKVKDEIIKLNQEGIVITEFEAITAVAMLYFAAENCDIVVLETGLGGRFDATNVIESPICSIITSVSLDHTAVLGNSIAEISFEKCGIIKDGCPVIFNSSQPDDFISTAVKIAEEKNSAVIIADESRLTASHSDITGTTIEYEDGYIRIPFPGNHQLKNTALVIACTEILSQNGFTINSDALKNGIESSFIPARTELISTEPLIILDGCHNPDSTQSLSELISRHLKGCKLLGLTSMMADKDIDKNLSNLCTLFETVVCTQASNPRRASAEDLSEVCSKYCKAEAFTGITDSILYCKNNLHKYDALIVFGSLYFASDIRELLKIHFTRGTKNVNEI